MGFDFGQFAQPFGYADSEAGIAAAQSDWGLPATGLLDAVTINVLTRVPRCGCPDTQPVAGQIDKWGIPVVSYYIDGYPVGLGLSTTQVDNTVKQAFDSWSAICGLKYAKAPDAQRANILIGTGRGRRANFDGPGNTLAWCELPQGDNFRGQVRMRYDLDEPWTLSSESNGILLLNTTAHEIGHANGLFHNNQKSQLMNPVYNPRIATPQTYEIAEMVQRYGKPAASPAPAPTEPGQYTPAIKVRWSDGSEWQAVLERTK